jgi:TolB protein
MIKYFACFLIFSFFFLPSVEARVYLDINAPAFVQIPIALSKWKSVEKTPSTLTAKLYEILTDNLTLSGFFKVIDYSQLPPSLRDREGIPNTLVLREWASSGGEILLAGEVALKPDGLGLVLTCHLMDLIEQRHLFGKRYEGHLQNFRSMVRRIADEVVLHLTGERGVHSTKIAYAVQQGTGKEIFTTDFDGANVKQITHNQSINISPVWTPNGEQIIFTSYLKRNPDLYAIDLEGKNLRRFSFYPGLNVAPSWSPDGKRIALMLGMEGKSDIYLIDADGKNPKKLTSGHGNEASPSWSPDGKRIAFVSDRSGSPQIYTMTSEGTDVRRLTFEGNYNTNPSWSPRGNRIAFCGRVGRQFHILTIGVDGSGLQKLTHHGNNEGPSWAPDGRYIAFSSTRTGGSKIFIMNTNGSNQRPLTSAKGGESSPAWSIRLE